MVTEEIHFTTWRTYMVREIAANAAVAGCRTGKGVLDERVMAVMGRVPRHAFVLDELQPYAYVDSPLPIGHGKTVSQPFMVALTTDLLDLTGHENVLEIGTGLGYQAAVLAELAGKVHSVEIIEDLADGARSRLARLGYDNIRLKVGDGYYGWPECGPFDRIVVTAAPDLVPAPLIQQLKPGGRMVVPTGLPDSQQLLLVRKDDEGRVRMDEVLPVRFAVMEQGERAG